MSLRERRTRIRGQCNGSGGPSPGAYGAGLSPEGRGADQIGRLPDPLGADQIGRLPDPLRSPRPAQRGEG